MQNPLHVLAQLKGRLSFPPSAETLANPAASILPSKHSNLKSAPGVECNIRILWHFADTRGIISAHYCHRLPEELSNVPPKNRMLPPPTLLLPSKLRSMQPSEEPNKWQTPSSPLALSSLSHHLVFSVTEGVFNSPAHVSKIRLQQINAYSLRGLLKCRVCIMRLVLLFQPHQYPLCRNIYTAICLQ